MAYNQPPARKEECLAAIQKALDQLQDGGALDRKAICDQFPEIPPNTIWTWCKRLSLKQPTRKEMNAAAQSIRDRAAAGVTDHLPAVPAPAALARDGGKALRRLDFGVEIPKLYADAEMLRAFAVKDTEDGERIRNPVAFEKSIKARASLIETSLKVLEQVWDMRMMQRFNELIIEEIGRESPECQRRILVRLAQLNEKHGINLNGLRF